MKKIAQLISLVLISMTAGAQVAYNYTYTTGTYTPVLNGIPVNNNQVWSNQLPWQAPRIPIGFPFYFLGQTYDSLYVSKGNISFDVYPSPKLCFMVLNFCVDRGTNTSLSPILYSLTGAPGSRILKIQWENAGYQGYPQDYANAQVWLYEEGSCLEVHYGPNAVCCADSYDYPYADATGEFIGVYDEDYNGSPALYALEGAPASASANTSVSSYHGMNGTPPNGSIYKLCPVIPNNTGINEDLAESKVNIYPNPANGLVQLEIDPAVKALSAAVMDISGRCVMNVSENGTCPSSLDLSNLESGIYFVQVRTSQGMIAKKVAKQ